MNTYRKLILLALVLVFLIFSCKTTYKEDRIVICKKNISGLEDIVNIDTCLVQPIDYTHTVSLNTLPVDEKKKKFIDLILPAILIAKLRLEDTLMLVKHLNAQDTAKLSGKEKKFLKKTYELYRADNFEHLKRKMTPPPNSIILAQAALESGWGTSRFFLTANNIFGVWSFDKNEPRIKASILRGKKAVYLKKYSSLSHSIDDYFLTIARGPYRDFRIKNMETDNPFELIPYLNRYSEMDTIYTDHLRKVIRYNDLEKYDDYQIDPKYLDVKTEIK
jgi:Bax protein